MGLFNRKENNKQNEDQLRKMKEEQFNNLVRIINDSTKIIDKTKNPETAVSRFDVIKDNLGKLFEYIPSGQNLELVLGGKEINSINDLYMIDELKSEWLKSNDEEKRKDNNLYNEALAKWVELFNKAIEDNIVTQDELLELENMQENLGLLESDTEIYWKNCKAKLPEIQSNTKIDKLNKLRISENSEWRLTATFGKSKSNVYKLVLSSIQIHPTYRESMGANSELIHEVTFTAKEILQFDELWKRIKNWKSTIIKINDELVDSRTLSKMLICYRDKLKSIESNPLFCYGASPFTFNIFGCHRTMLRDGVIASQKCWYHIGRFDDKNVFHVDKKAISALLVKNVYQYRICPALNITNLEKGLDMLPETINPNKDKNWIVEKDYMNNKYLLPTIKYEEYNGPTLTEQVGDIDVKFTTSIAMVDYYSSISPQFEKVIEELVNKNAL